MSSITVLLVEDSKVQKLANERILNKAGYIVLNAADGEEAVRIAQEKVPDLILLDMMLPKLSGPDVLRALKKQSTTANIPIIVLTSLSQNNEAKLKLEGATAYFEKSRLSEGELGQNSFLNIIEKVLKEAKAPRVGAVPAH